MGERYTLDEKCVYCGKKNNDIWYAPTSNSYTFKCEKCGGTNFITSDLKVIKLEEVTLQHIKDGFEMTTSVDWSEKKIDEMCRKISKQLGVDELREIVIEKLKKIKNGNKRKKINGISKL